MHPASVATTLELTVKRVAQAYPVATNFLQLCTFLYPESIPEEIFTNEAATLALQEVATDPYQFDLLLATVRSASLIRRDARTRTLSLHRLVQAILQDQMDQSEARQWKDLVICAINAVFPEGIFENWDACERYVVQALACVSLIQQETNAQAEAGSLLYKVGGRVLAGARTLSRSRTVAERFGTAGGTAIWSRSLRADNIFVQLKRKNLTVCADDDTSCYASILLPGSCPYTH